MADRLGIAIKLLRCVQNHSNIMTESCRMQCPVIGFHFGVRVCWVRALKPDALEIEHELHRQRRVLAVWQHQKYYHRAMEQLQLPRSYAEVS